MTARRQPPKALGELLDAGEVARALGLSNQKGVGAYRARYPDFPAPAVVKNSGRCLLWWAPDIYAWREKHPARWDEKT